MSKVLKYVLIGIGVIGGLFIIGFLIFNFMIASAFGAFDKTYSVTELKQEYFSKEKEIDDLIKYFNQIKPKDKQVDIEFKNNKTLDRLRIEYLDSTQTPYQQWGVQVASLTKPEFKKDLNWTEENVEKLKEKLDAANCISIEDGEPIKIGFKRSGMGMFSFVVFQKKETDRGGFDNGCTYILVNKKLALEYGGGAIGSQCFPNKN